MTFRVRYTGGARRDLLRLYEFLLDRDVAATERALEALRKSTEILEEFPFTCRKADANNPFLRELIVPFGSSGYVVLFEIDDATTVTILAVRHQRDDDYY
ncbi:type II toxin-antitoxin system RelE/ParE family toxin [Paraburkholderia caribensis]|uniref:Type II toxin-antitoxin system RelE/ParE family toxin n=1 Tax=Paraburkholderia caribensis TaxID=75105 RepID=A0ABV0E8K8_9BURK|nr:type II toxin-antitoxin system RelE/ParE family toxin [Paraburkholderia caribensis]MCO4882556.1 type II toxin-antitoxin system RelE/ParE family toxin [Paraburkholderia caribensis]PTB24104.1 plasmid stabilization protein [Paraburkholderia caribensis]